MFIQKMIVKVTTETLSRLVKGYNLKFIQTKALCHLRTRVVEKWQRVRKADQNVK